MTLLVILFFLAIIFTVASKGMYKSFVNPLFIFVAVNMLSIVLSVLMDSFEGYSDLMTLYIVVMFISFYIGVRLAYKVNNQSPNETYNHEMSFSYNTKLRKLIIVISVIYNIALIFYLRNLFSQYTIAQFFLEMGEVNKYVQSEDFKSGWFSYVVAVGTPLAVIIIAYAKNTKWNLFLVLQFIMCFLHCVSPRRSELFNFIVVIGFYMLLTIQSKQNTIKIKRKNIYLIGAVLGVLFIGIMISTQALLGKNAEQSISVMGIDIPPAFVDPYTYYALNYPYIDALPNQRLVDSEVPFHSTLRLFYIIMNRLGLASVDIESAFDLDFLWFGDTATNTAPLLYYAFKDCGYFFFLLFLLLGYISQKAYYSGQGNSISGRLFASYIYCLLLSSNRGYLIIYLSFALALFYILLIHLKLRNKYERKNNYTSILHR